MFSGPPQTQLEMILCSQSITKNYIKLEKLQKNKWILSVKQRFITISCFRSMLANSAKAPTVAWLTARVNWVTNGNIKWAQKPTQLVQYWQICSFLVYFREPAFPLSFAVSRRNWILFEIYAVSWRSCFFFKVFAVSLRFGSPVTVMRSFP